MRKLRWASAALLAMALTVAGQTSALAQPSGKPIGPTKAIDLASFGAPPAGFRSWAEAMAVQNRLDAQAERILAHRDDGYTGISVDVAKRRLTVFWKGTPPASATRAIELARRDVAVDVAGATYSEKELLGETARVARGGGVTAASPNVDGTGISITVSPGARANVRSTVPITRTDSATPQAATRGNDSPPYYGGARWGGCSTGFAITVGGARKMLSAGHCAANGDTVYDGGGDLMGTVSGDDNSRDRLYINVSSAGRVFNGGVGSGEYTNAVIGSLRSFVGDYVCTSGAYSGTRCNIQVKVVNETIDVGYLIYGVVRAEQLDRQNAVGNGDSGGPVEAIAAADTTEVYAKGTNTAIDTSTATACTGIPAGGGRTCAWRMWYADVTDSLSAYGASIVTG